MQRPTIPEAVADWHLQAPEESSLSESLRVRLSRLTIDDTVVLLSAVALLTVALPFTFTPSSTPRLIVVLALLPLGILRLGGGVARRDLASCLAAAFLAWVTLSSSLSDAPGVALLGAYGRDTSAVILIGAVGGWAIARHLSEDGRQLLVPVMLGCLVLNALVCILQVVTRAPGGTLSLVNGRAFGLLTGPIFFGALMAGGASLVSAGVGGLSRRPTLILVGVFAACANLSGSRFPVALGLAGVVVVLALQRRTRSVVSFVLAYLLGLVLSTGLSAFFTSNVSAAGRADSEAAGRLRAWRYGLEAVVDRPLFGWGAGNFRPAVQGRFSADFTSRHARDELSQIWFDPHNIVVAFAVGFGIVGLVLCGAFVWFAVQRVSGPLLAFAAVVAASWLLEPAALVTLPIALVALGAAFRPSDVPDAETHASPAKHLGTLLALVGVMAGMTFLVIDVRLANAIKSNQPDRVAEAARWTPWDPVAANAVAAAYFNGADDAASRQTALGWMKRSRDRQPDWPFYHNAIAEIYLSLDDPEAARAELEAALELQPWNVQSLELMLEVARRTEDAERLADATAALCLMEVDSCS